MELTRSKVQKVIELAEVLYGPWPPPKAEPEITSLADYDLDEWRNNPDWQALWNFVDGLSDREQAELITIMYIGRDDFSPEDFDKERALMENQPGNASQICSKKPLGAYLRRGLDQLSDAKIELVE